MDIEILHIADCDNWRVVGERVREVLAELGDTRSTVTTTLLSSAEDAARVSFAGSPTVLIDGADAFPSEGRTSDLACRIYRADGRFAGSPTIEDLRAVIASRGSAGA